MESSKIKEIIQTFFNREVSPKTLYIFGKWFRLNEDTAEKEWAMEEIWENSPATPSSETIEDFAKIKAQLHSTQKKKYSLTRTIIASVAALLLAIISTMYLTYKIAVPAPLEYTQLSVAHGESQEITLQDGSIVAINAGSTLIYPKSFTGDTRMVFLTGEANFSIAKNPQKPFIVKTKYIDIKALGTKFCVQSYPNSLYTKATLIEGSILIEAEKKHRSYILKPNNQLVYSNSNNKVNIINVDASKIASWEEGYLIFQGATFDEIAQTLERKYNVTINYDQKKLNQQSYFIQFNPDETIDDAMSVLTILIHKSSYKKSKNKIFFYTK